MKATAESKPEVMPKRNGLFFANKTGSAGNENFFIQPKLTINQPNDIYEQEADAIADRVMRMPMNDQPFFSAKPVSVSHVQRKCAHCEEEEKQIQKKPANEIIQRDDKETTGQKAIDEDPDIDPFKLKTTFHPDLNYMPVHEELNYRGVPYPLSYYDESNLEFARQYQFYKHFGLGKLAQKAGTVPVLKLFVPDLPGMDPDAALANITTPMSVGSALRRDYPLSTERDDTNMHLFNLKTWHFDLGGGGSRIRRKCAHCEEEEKQLQKKDSGNSPTPVISPTVEQTLQSSGQLLDNSARSFMEQRFGYDFSDVQIHNDALAHQSSKDINALAYTRENHVVFGAGQYQPDTDAGKKLMAHELTHVVQQNHLKHSAIYTKENIFRKVNFDDDPKNYIYDINPAEEDVNEIKTPGSSKMGQTFMVINATVIEEGKPITPNPLNPPQITTTPGAKNPTCAFTQEATNEMSFRMYLPSLSKWEFIADVSDLKNLAKADFSHCSKKVTVIVIGDPNETSFRKSVLAHESIHKESILKIYNKFLVAWDKKIHDRLNNSIPAKDAATCEHILFQMAGSDMDELLSAIVTTFNTESKAFHDTKEGGKVTPSSITVDCNKNTVTIHSIDPMPVPK